MPKLHGSRVLVAHMFPSDE